MVFSKSGDEKGVLKCTRHGLTPYVEFYKYSALIDDHTGPAKPTYEYSEDHAKNRVRLHDVVQFKLYGSECTLKFKNASDAKSFHGV